MKYKYSRQQIVATCKLNADYGMKMTGMDIIDMLTATKEQGECICLDGGTGVVDCPIHGYSTKPSTKKKIGEIKSLKSSDVSVMAFKIQELVEVINKIQK